MENIFAFTEIDYRPAHYPGFVSLNLRDGKYFLSVRSRDAQNVSEVEIPEKELIALTGNIDRLMRFGANKE